MRDTAVRNSAYINELAESISKEYNLAVTSITPAKRGYYGETWCVDTEDSKYFVKLDYLSRHQNKYKNSLSVVQYLCDNGINFISKIVKTRGGELSTSFNSAVLAVFEWINGENIETDDTKPPEYKMLSKIYLLSKQGFDIPAIKFLDDMAKVCLEKWNSIKKSPKSLKRDGLLAILDGYSKEIFGWAKRLAHFSSVCSENTSDFYITHGDAGGNLMTDGKNFAIMDWDEVMYAPLERDAWVMCCYDWAFELFENSLRQSGIGYRLKKERLAFYIYHMFFLYLNEFLEDFEESGDLEIIKEYFNGFIRIRLNFADSI